MFSSVVSIFLNINNDLFTKKQQIPDQTIVTTPYGGRLVVTMPHGNTLTVHYKNKKLIRHKKRWSQVIRSLPSCSSSLFGDRVALSEWVYWTACGILQVMYLYYLLGWKVSTKYFKRWGKGEEDVEVKNEFEVRREKTNGHKTMNIFPNLCIWNVWRSKLRLFLQREKKNTYILALDGDTDFTPAAVMLLIDRLKLYPQVGAACGRIHPTGSGGS